MIYMGHFHVASSAQIFVDITEELNKSAQEGDDSSEDLVCDDIT